MQLENIMKKNRKTLLLGAGFTANFGAPIASQVWNDLFNNITIQKNRRLKNKLKRHRITSDFEQFYEDVVYGNGFNNEEKSTVAKTVVEIFNRINISTELSLESSEINFNKLFYFLQRFSYSDEGKGFIFTLNQDLFLEKLINKHMRGKNEYKDSLIAYPGPINVPYISKNWQSTLPTKEQLNAWLSNPNLGGSLHANKMFPQYIKLHGSSGWTTENGLISLPVVGKNKSKQISAQPLLKWYLDIFEESLNEQLDIWIIGYSFSDPHINRILMQAVNKTQSSIYIIDTKSQNDFMSHLKRSTRKPFYSMIDNCLSGYFPCYLKQIFPHGDDARRSYYEEMVERSLNKTTVTSILDDMMAEI